jgi:hypothetical protein
MGVRSGADGRRGLWRSRWAAIGAAVAVTLGGGGLFVANAASSEPSSVVTIAPIRILDTRTDVGLPGPFVSAVSQKLQVTGPIPTSAGTQSPVPAGATGVLLNVTVVGPTAAGFLSVRPGDATGQPSTSSLNFRAGDIVPNSVQVGLPTVGTSAGKIDITYDAFGQAGPTTEVLIDVVGYMVAAGDDRYYTKSEVDARLALLHNSVAVFAGGQQDVALVETPTVVRSVSLMPPSNGTVIVTSSAYLMQGIGSTESGARCSISTGTDIDYDFLQISDLRDDKFKVLAGTRGFSVTKGVLLTVNLVCDEFQPQIFLGASSLTAIFAPT